MRLLSKPLILSLAILGFGGCQKGPKFLSQHGDAPAGATSETETSAADKDEKATLVVATVVSDDGTVHGLVSSSATGTQVVNAGSGSLSGASASFPAGSLAIDTEVSLIEGATLATPAELSPLGLDGSTVSSSASALIIDAEGDLDPVSPMTVRIPMPDSSGLKLQGDDPHKLLVVLFKIQIRKEKRVIIGILPREALLPQDGFVEFTQQYFGSFQAVYLTLPVAKKQADAATPIQTKTGKDVGTVAKVNTPPVAKAGTLAVAHDQAAQGILKGEDKDGDALTFKLGTLPAHGTVTLLDKPAGAFVFEPTPGASGTDSFTFTVSDGKISSAAATISVAIAASGEVTPPADVSPPAAPVVTGAGTINSSRPTWTWVSGGGGGNGNYRFKLDDTNLASGAVETAMTSQILPIDLTAGSHVLYVQERDVAGNWSMSGAATVIIVNNPPVAVADSYTTNEDTVLVKTLATGVLSNDTDADANPLTAVLVANVSNGSLTLNANGSFTYTPSANYSGADSFSYKANDGAADSGVATVNLTVSAVNDAPVATNISPAAFNEDVQSIITLAYSDAESDAASACAASSLTNVTVTQGCVCAGGVCTVGVTGTTNYNGSASFTYTVTAAGQVSNSATATLTINAINDAPVTADDSYSVNEDTMLNVSSGSGLLVNDSDPEGQGMTTSLEVDVGSGSLSLNSNGSFTYTPALNASGIVTFTYRAVDASTAQSTVTTVTITVNAVNDTPQWTVAFSEGVVRPGNAFSFTATAADVESAVTYSLDLTNMTCDNQSWSPQIAVNSSTGAITGTPTATGTCTVKVVATDGSLSAAETFNVTRMAARTVVCDFGDLDTTCYVSTTHTVPDEGAVWGNGNLIIQNGGVLSSNAAHGFYLDMVGSLTVEDGGQILANLPLARASNITIEGADTNPAGRIDASGLGYQGVYQGNGEGPSGTLDNVGFRFDADAGAMAYYAGGGGGGGGAGGTGTMGFPGPEAPTPAAPAHGSAVAPTSYGSSGGGGGGTVGGNGGGAIKLVSPGTITIDGFIKANGTAGGQAGGGTEAHDGAGGGGGGSIWIVAGTFTGSGQIQAKGAAGGGDLGSGSKYYGGGGGGGRIALYPSGGSYTTVFSVTGGFAGGTDTCGTPCATAGAVGSLITPPT